MGLREESGECFVMSEDGVIKVRSYNRRSEEERWNQEEFNKGRGTPWEPIPGEGPIQVKSRFRIRDRPDEEEPLKAPEIREAKPRRIYIVKSDLDKYDYTPGCKGCIAANRGQVSVPHNEQCRLRIEAKIETEDPERYNRALSRMIEQEAMKRNPENPEKPRNHENPVKSGPVSQPVKPVNPVEVTKEEGAK